MDYMESKNLLYGLSSAIIGIALLFSIANADCKTKEECDYIQKNEKTINSVEEHYKELEKRKINVDTNKLLPSEEQMKQAEKYKDLTKNQKDVSKYQELGNKIDWDKITKIYGSNYLEMQMKINQMLQSKNEKKQVVFYLISTSMPKETIINVIQTAKKENVELYPVLRGLNRKGYKPVERFIFEWVNDLNNQIGGGIRVKVNPIIFNEVQANVVPAFVLADCPERYFGIIRSKSCQFKAVLYGDVSLDFAIERFKEAGLWKE